MRSYAAVFAILLFSQLAIGQTSVDISFWAFINDCRSGKRVGNIEVSAERTRPIVVPRNAASIVIDGKVDDAAWQQAAVFKDFYQTNPGNNTAPSKPTEVLMMYDEKNLYVAFRCWDEPDKIRATLAKRDNVFNEDNVRMWLDTYDDQRRAYILGFNPLGIQQDGIFTEGSGADFTVDIVMESKGVILDWGWSVEAKIPFKSLRYSAGKGKYWGFNVARNIDRFNDEFDQWMPDDRNISGTLIKHGKITGLDEVKYERTLEVVPSITVSQTGNRKRTINNAGFGTLGPYDPVFNPIGIRDPGRFVNDPVKPDLSVNLKYNLSPNVTLDAAVNPDFAEIEADAPVVSANQRFPIYFEEKRPFFLEGKDIFSSPLQPFYSRTIVDPDLAAKLTGKIGRNTFGILVASDNAPGNYSDDERGELLNCQRAREFDPPNNKRRCGIEEFIDKNAFFGVLRLKRDFGKENNVGFYATARTFPKNRNFTGGFDGTFKLDPKTVMKFQVLGTHSRKFFYDPNLDRAKYRTGNGFGYSFNIDYTTDRHGWFLEAEGTTADYRTDAGFTSRTDTNSFFFANRVSTKSNPNATIIRANWVQFAKYGLDWKGRTQFGLVGNNVDLSLQGNMSIHAEFGVQYEKIYEHEFGPTRNPANNRLGAFFGDPTRSATQPYVSINANKTVSKQFSIYGFVGSIFNAFDYDFGAGPRYPRSSPAFSTYLGGPEYQTYIAGLYAYQADPINNPYPNFAEPPQLDPGSGWQFDANVGFEYKPSEPLRISMDYTKSRLTRNDNKKTAYDTNIFTVRSTYQFTRFIYVKARWDYDTLNSNASGQFLFGWNPNPGTAFYVGYNDNFNYKGYSPFTGQFEPGFERNSRTFFLRASYLFRKSF
ncbi:MAG: carbohydrate binding family 9 domain-containing protein [Chloracidobacterium sp.]|nr:carbohydrate binding family 9 domain-containing protein [Chloracidobacterium sp.]